MKEFYERFNEALNIRNKTMADISRDTGINRSSLSEYSKGTYKPEQDRLYLIAKALNVSPAWLMGFDVNMEPNNEEEHITLTQKEKELLKYFKITNSIGRSIIIDTSKNIAKAYPKPSRQEMIDYLREMPRAAWGGAKNVFNMSDEELETEYNRIRKDFEDVD